MLRQRTASMFESAPARRNSLLRGWDAISVAMLPAAAMVFVSLHMISQEHSSTPQGSSVGGGADLRSLSGTEPSKLELSREPAGADDGAVQQSGETRESQPSVKNGKVEDGKVEVGTVQEGVSGPAGGGFVLARPGSDDAGYSAGDDGSGSPRRPVVDVYDFPELAPGGDVSVALVQRELSRVGWILVVDGIAGPATGLAVREFQHANGLDATGVIDEVTRDLVFSADAADVYVYRSDPLPSAPRLSEGEILARARAIADETGFPWRDHGVSFAVGCSPHSVECAGGSYEPTPKLVLLRDDIYRYRDRSLFRYVVLHELAHAWQFNVRGWPDATDDLAAWGFSGMVGLEYAADCLAAAWGARHSFAYWDCPADAAEHMRGLFLSNPG